MYKKCFHKKMNYSFNKRLADCCSDKNGVAGSLTIVEKRSVSSNTGESQIWEADIFRTRPEGSEGFDCFFDEGYSEIIGPCGARWW